MRRYVGALLIAALLAGCSSNPSATPPASFILPTFSLTAPVRGLRDLTSTVPLAYVKGARVVPIAQLTDIETNQGRLGLVLWGTRNSSTDAIERVTEAQVAGMGSPPGSVHVFFNVAMQPVLFRDDASGYSVAIARETPSRQRVTLCDPSFDALAHTTVTDINGTAHVDPVSAGGSCVIQHADLIRAVAPRANGCHGDPSTVAYQLCQLGPLITAGSYVAGFGFAILAIAKFQGHKEKPIPIGTPIALVFIAAALMFLPSVFKASGATIFGHDPVPVSGVAALYVPQESLPGCSATAPPGNCPFPHPEPTPP